MALVSLFVFFVLSNLVLLHSAEEGKGYFQKCQPFHCGNFSSIHFPFTNTTPPECGLSRVNCVEGKPMIQIGFEWDKISRSYEVISFPLSNTTQSKTTSIRIKDQALEEKLSSQNCEALTNLTFPDYKIVSFELITPKQTFFKCNHTLNITAPKNFKTWGCNDYNIYYSHSNDSSPRFHSECSIIHLPVKGLPDYDNLFTFLTAEFDLEVHVSDSCLSCHRRGGQCFNMGEFYCSIAEKEKKKLPVILVATLFIGIGVLVVIIVYLWGKLSSIKINYFWKKETLTYQSVEAFLRNHGPLAIRRYSYSDIKKMTNSFKDKLGQGGYGGVYKGKLQDGCFVAVKVLKESKGNGEEFLNEVASISRTSHVNIVTLMGFCFESSKRALIYEFMPNGSLEKFIYKVNSSNPDHQLGWETLYKITVGTARGLEYLHGGCNTRILHFDIKPHNILLDENFSPKISDFGLAKICSREESIISMLGARGTAGFIAPEVFSRNFGGVSHKSDVYSYGMMVLEMVGGRKNIDANVDRTSEIYFPHWVYRRLELDEELGLLGLINKEDEETARKMIIVSLWCIQTNPSNRPSMTKVVDMLVGNLDSLQTPPKPFLSSPPRTPVDSSMAIVSL